MPTEICAGKYYLKDPSGWADEKHAHLLFLGILTTQWNMQDIEITACAIKYLKATPARLNGTEPCGVQPATTEQCGHLLGVSSPAHSTTLLVVFCLAHCHQVLCIIFCPSHHHGALFCY